MPERCLTRWLSAVVVTLLAAGALAQTPQEPGRPVGHDVAGERPRGDGERGRMIDIGQMIEADLAWLREHDLGAYADKVAALRDSDNAMKRITLWRVHGRIEGWRRLQGEDQRRALEDVRLDLAMAKLARAAREAAEGPARQQALRDLRQAIERQVDLRMEVNKALTEMIEKRLAAFREQLAKQAALRQDLVAQRLASLTDVSTPLPDPMKDLVMEASDQERDGRPKSPPEPPPPPPENGGKAAEPPPAMQAPMGRMAEQFDKQIDLDIQWLREKGLTAFADRLAAIRKESGTEGNRFLLWQIHRRIQQIRSLRGDDATTAIEGERLRFAVIDLARQWREAAPEARAALAEKLKESLARQFDLRQKAQEAILAGIKARLAETQASVEKLLKNRQAIVDRRFAELTDLSRPIPEPSLLPEPRGEPRRGGRDRDGGPGPGDPGSRPGDPGPHPAGGAAAPANAGPGPAPQ